MKKIQNFELADYIGALTRRFLWILVPTLLVGLGNAIFVKTIPDVYESQTVILVEPQKIPTDYVRPTSTGSIQSRLSTITQQIMSRTRLEKIIIDNDLYSAKRKRMPMEEVVDLMRQDIILTVNKTDAFTLAYQANEPTLAQKVTSQIAGLYIEENLKAREQQTEGVNQFLDAQLKETESKLMELEGKLRDFKLQHLGALPEQQAANLAALSRLQLQMQAGMDSVNRIEEQKRTQERLLTEYKKFSDLQQTVAPDTSVASTPPTNPLSGELEAKKAMRNSLLKRYTANHPEIRKLEAEISALEETKAPPSAGNENHERVSISNQENQVSTLDVELVQLRSQIDTLNDQLQQGLKEQEKIRKEMMSYEARVDSIPRIEQMQKEITRDYDTTQKHYQTLLAKKNEAEMATDLERRQKGEQFRILDPASLPETPSKPNRVLLNLLGIAVGLGIGSGLAIVLELKDDSVRTEHELVRLTNLPVLVSIPMIQVNKLGLGGETTLRKRLRKLLPGGVKSDRLS